jgi:hypothetical protein
MAERKSFLLRVDEALYEELRRWASAELRSVNAQIEFILRRAVRERRGVRTEDGPPSKG